jgi:hypothetical protein
MRSALLLSPAAVRLVPQHPPHIFPWAIAMPQEWVPVQRAVRIQDVKVRADTKEVWNHFGFAPQDITRLRACNAADFKHSTLRVHAQIIVGAARKCLVNTLGAIKARVRHILCTRKLWAVGRIWLGPHGAPKDSLARVNADTVPAGKPSRLQFRQGLLIVERVRVVLRSGYRVQHFSEGGGRTHESRVDVW